MARSDCRKCGGDGLDGFMGPCDCVVYGRNKTITSSRAEAAEARVRELEQKLAEEERGVKQALDEVYGAALRRAIDLDAAEARVRELESPPLGSHAADLQCLRATQSALDLTEARLATATALIREALDGHNEDPDGNIGCGTANRLRAFLANQPAAPDPADRVLAWAGPAARADLGLAPAVPTSAESELAQLRARVAKATYELSNAVSVLGPQPAYVDRALEALRGPK